jgi:glycerol uptake facilitator-like aquaporin
VSAPRPPLARRVLAELVGTGMLVAVVVGSGIAAARLSPADRGLQLLENSTTTALGLAVLILLFAPVSGAHFNPVVTLADRVLVRRSAHRLPVRDVLAYLIAQVVGAVGGAVLANAMFDLTPVQIATTARGSTGVWLAEIVATAGLVALIFTLARTGRSSLSAAAVGAYIGAAYWFTSSTSFANPAVTVGRIFSDTFAGIAPGSMPPFVLAQLVGAALGVGLVLVLYPEPDARVTATIGSTDEPTSERSPA